MPDYFERADCNGKFFRCAPYSIEISVAQCAASWEAARRTTLPGSKTALEAGDRKCKTCPIGQAHATGSDPATAIPASPFFQAPICPRCTRDAGATCRMRLIKGELCISCHNRQWEFLRGYNGKGSPPKIAEIPARSIAYHDGERVNIHRRQHAMHTVETMIAVLREVPRAVAFGFMSAVRASAPA